MAPIRNARIIMAEFLPGQPEPGKSTVYDDTQKIDIDVVPLHGGLLLKTLFLGIDPYLRARMRPKSPVFPIGYTLGEPILGFGVAVVLRSENDGAKAGDHVYGDLEYQEYTVRSSTAGLTILKDKRIPLSAYLGVAGLAGQTAYAGWKEFSKAKTGDIAFITTGAGGVGSLVIQLAKADGVKVIASAGSDEKVAFMKSLGADVAFNYKTTNTREVLDKEGPINIFWDNVGGETLDTALQNATLGARFIECGMSSTYDAGGVAVIKNLFQIIPKGITLTGINVSQQFPKYAEEFYATVPDKVAKGEFKYWEEVTRGLDRVNEVISGMIKGTNKAKAIIQVADELQ